MAMKNITELVSTAINDFNSIQNIIFAKGVPNVSHSSIKFEKTANLSTLIGNNLFYPSENNILNITSAGDFSVLFSDENNNNRNIYSKIVVPLFDKQNITHTITKINNSYIFKTKTTNFGWIERSTELTETIAEAEFSVNKNKVTVSSNGYIESGKKIAEINVGELSLNSRIDFNYESISTITADSSDTDAYKLEIKSPLVLDLEQFSEGYITSNDIKLAGSSLTKYFKKLSFEESSSIPSAANVITYTPDRIVKINKGILLDNSYISISTEATAAAENILEGKTAWINGSKITGSLKDSRNQNIIITDFNFSEDKSKPAVVALTGKLSSNYSAGVIFNDKNSFQISLSKATLENSVDLKNNDGVVLYDKKLQDNDYYELEFTNTNNLSKGYLVDDITQTTKKTVYIPKAKFIYEDDNPNLIKCQSSGYIEAGAFSISDTVEKDFAEISTTINSDNINIFSQKDTTNTFYKISSSYSLKSSGYFDSSATVENETKYIQKGKLLKNNSTELTEGQEIKLTYKDSLNISKGLFINPTTVKVEISDGKVTVQPAEIRYTKDNTKIVLESGSYILKNKNDDSFKSSVTLNRAGYIEDTSKIDSKDIKPVLNIELTKAIITRDPNKITETDIVFAKNTDTDFAKIVIEIPATEVPTEGYISEDDIKDTLKKEERVIKIKKETTSNLSDISTTDNSPDRVINTSTNFDKNGNIISGSDIKEFEVLDTYNNSIKINTEKYKNTYFTHGELTGVITSDVRQKFSVGSDTTGSGVDNLVQQLLKRLLGAEKNVIFFSDSYGALEGYIPSGYRVYYTSTSNPPIDKPEDMWWGIIANNANMNIVRNDSWSGSTIYNSGSISFIGRLRKLIEDDFFKENRIDAVFVLGGLNDFYHYKNGTAILGEEKYSNWTEDDLKNILPGISYFFYKLREVLPKAEIYGLVNNITNGDGTSFIKEEIKDAIRNSCFRTNSIPIEFTIDTTKRVGVHPKVEGMKQIADQILEAIGVTVKDTE